MCDLAVAFARNIVSNGPDRRMIKPNVGHGPNIPADSKLMKSNQGHHVGLPSFYEYELY